MVNNNDYNYGLQPNMTACEVSTMTKQQYYLLSIRIAGGNELDICGKRASLESTITHDLLNETNGISGVGFVKE